MTTPSFTRSSDRPVLMSHAGDTSQGAAAGSLGAYQLAWDKGFRCFQVDVVALDDGTLLSSHAITGRKRKWEQLTLADLRGAGKDLHTVDEIVDALPDAAWNIEIKSGHSTAALTAYLRRQDLPLDRYLISSPFRPSILLQLRSEFGSDLALAAALVDGGLIGYRLWPRRQYADAVQLWFPLATSTVVQSCQVRQLDVQIWSLNSRSRIERHLAQGVDGVITDAHDLGLSVVGDFNAGGSP